ncbi:MAG: hypothetical protein RI995_768 [Bacteroidota bacterium]|jgi:hypothetical protein
MNDSRRLLLKQMSISLAAMSLPNWAHGWRSENFQGSSQLISALVEAILPETDIPGGKSVGADKFIERMVKDCFDTKTQQAFMQGLASFDEQCKRLFKTGFEKLPLAQQIDFLKNIEARGSSEDKMVLQILKKLTIQAYTNSEYFLTKHRNYTIAPGFYHGCTPINS